MSLSDAFAIVPFCDSVLETSPNLSVNMVVVYSQINVSQWSSFDTFESSSYEMLLCSSVTSGLW